VVIRPDEAGTAPAGTVLLTMKVGTGRHVFLLRRLAKVCAAAAGLENRDQVRVATVVSELGRDLLGARGLNACFRLGSPARPALTIEFEWTDERAASAESLAAVARLLPQVSQSRGDAAGAEAGAEQGGRIVIDCPLPAFPGSADDRAREIREAVRAEAGSGTTAIDDLQAQSRDLLTALAESRAQSEELQRLNAELEETNQGVMALYAELSQELEETNRGVVALYAELDEKSRLLREASESKTRFWSNISHELRTPINSVIGLSRLMLDPGSEPLTEEQRRQVALIAASGSTLLALVNELLDVAKAEAGRLVPQYAPVDLPALLAQMHGMMAGTVAGPNVRLIVADGHGLPHLHTDEVMLARILRNLMSNSLKFTTSGRVRLTVAEEPGSRLRFTVSDTGVGIPADQQTKIFEEFYQVPGLHQRNRPGTGLGLPYALRLAKLLGGDLELESEPGRGTTVILRLPVRPAAGAGPLRRLGTVLAVDDDAAFAEAFRPVLAELAEHVIQVSSGAAALAAAREHRPDALVLDLQMPGLDGYGVLDALAADAELSRIPVVVVTGADPAEPAGLGHARAVLAKDEVTARRLAEVLGQPSEGAVDEPH
jgi:signal transduction histidine kinase